MAHPSSESPQHSDPPRPRRPRPGSAKRGIDDRVLARGALLVACASSLLVVGVVSYNHYKDKKVSASNELSSKNVELEWLKNWTPPLDRLEADLKSQARPGENYYVFSSGSVLFTSNNNPLSDEGAAELLLATPASLEQLRVNTTPKGDFIIRFEHSLFFWLYRDIANADLNKVNENWDAFLSEDAKSRQESQPIPSFGIKCSLLASYLLEQDQENPQIVLKIAGPVE